MDTPHGTRILPNLYRVAWWDCAGKDVVNCDVYAVNCGKSVVLVDSGRGGLSFPFLKANLEYWGLWDRLRACLLTHLHRDHAGGVSQLQAAGVPAWSGPRAAAFGERKEAQEYFGNQVPRIDRVLEDGETIDSDGMAIKVLETPGHTSTCMSYVATIDSISCAFTGDMVMPNGTTGYTGSFDFNAEDLIGSLRRLLQHEFDAVLTGHMLRSSQPEGFWMRDGRGHVVRTLEAILAKQEDMK